MTIRSVHKSRLSVLAGIAALSFVVGIAPAGAQTTTTKAGQTRQGGAGRGGANRAFCRQVTDSQATITASKADTVAKLTLTAGEWVKIEGRAPETIKPKVTIVRKAYQAASAAKNNTAVKAQAVVDAGKAITTFVTANCNNAGGGGFNSAALADYQACLKKNGVTLPAPGANQTPLNQNDPKVAAALKACQDKLPAGGRGFGGGGGGGGFAAIQDCLTKKGVTLPGGPGRGQGGSAAQGGTSGGPGQGGTPPQFDAKTQKAITDCRAEAAKATPTTTKKK